MKLDSGRVVFSHNDLQYGNILRLSVSRELLFLDYEYAGSNYDFANHFCEWMANNDSSMPHILDPSLYPSKEIQTQFIRHYLKTQRKFGYYQTSCIEDILERVLYFTAISHLLWGIFRGTSLLNMRKDFDYLSYGLGRIHLYFKMRSMLLL